MMQIRYKTKTKHRLPKNIICFYRYEITNKKDSSLLQPYIILCSLIILTYIKYHNHYSHILKTIHINEMVNKSESDSFLNQLSLLVCIYI